MRSRPGCTKGQGMAGLAEEEPTQVVSVAEEVASVLTWQWLPESQAEVLEDRVTSRAVSQPPCHTRSGIQLQVAESWPQWQTPRDLCSHGFEAQRSVVLG